MADFHAYEITVRARIVIPANEVGVAATFNLASLPAKVKEAIIAAVPSVTVTAAPATIGAPLAVTLP